MKILGYADLHLHYWHTFGEVEYEGRKLPRRLVDQQKVLDQILDVIVEEKVDVLAFAGDLFHKRGEVPVECMNMARTFYTRVAALGVETVSARGNHDLRNDVDYCSLSDSIGIVTHAKQQDFAHKGVKIKCVNYSDEVTFSEVVGYDLVILHKQPTLIQTFTSGGTHEHVGMDWKPLAAQNKQVFFGHFHSPTKLSDNCQILGSALQLQFGDDKPRGVYLLDTDTNLVKFIPLKSPRFISVQTSDEVKDDGNYYKVLRAEKKTDSELVVNVSVPEIFEERIKANGVTEVLKEWAALFEQTPVCLNVGLGLLKPEMVPTLELFTGTLKEVIIHDFLSVGDVSFEVTPGMVLLSGENGAGKSSIVEAIYWALTGKTTKELTGNDVIRDRPVQCKDASVQLKFKDGDRGLVVDRSRKLGLQVIISGQDVTAGFIEKDKQQRLNSLLGFDEDVFKASCYFSQENLVTLSGLSDVGKTNIVMNLLGFGVYDLLYAEATAVLKVEGTEVDACNDVVKQHEHEIALLQNSRGLLTDQFKGVKEARDRTVSEIVAKVADLDSLQIASTSEATSTISELQTQIENLDTESVSVYEELAALSNENAQGAQSTIDVLVKQMSEHDLKYREVFGEKRSLVHNIDSLKHEVDVLKSSSTLAGGKCDKCGSVITGEALTAAIVEKRELADSLATKVTALDIEGDVIEEAKGKLQAEKASLELAVQTKRDLKVTLMSKTNTLVVEKSQEVAQTQRSALEKDIVFLRKTVEEKDAACSDIEVKMNSLDTSEKVFKDKILDEEIKLKELSVMIGHLEFWKKAFSPQGIKAVLLDRFCNEFNALVASYISEASGGEMGVCLSPRKLLKSGESRNSLSIQVLDDGLEKKYTALSGGEKARVNFALCMALNVWVTHKYNLPGCFLGFILFDELFGSLDKKGEESIASLLYKEGQDKCIYVISHTDELKDYAERIWTVEKFNGVTQLNRISVE